MEEELSKDENNKIDGQSFVTPAFEGPLDLLLFLIQKSKINIYDIPISTITEQFLDYIHNCESIDLNNLSDFYKMAADLLYIKSRMLLPVDVEFDEEYEDPRQDLVERLLEYQKFRKYSDLLASGVGDGDLYIERKKSSFMIPFEDQELFEDVTVKNLLDTFSKIISKISPTKIFNVYEEVTVNEKLALMSELFETKDKITIEDIIIHPDKALHIICAFMAILEACKFKMISIEQDEPFGNIYITKKDNQLDIVDVDADEIDDMYEKAIQKGLYKEKELFDREDDFSIKSEKQIEKIKQEVKKEEKVPSPKEEDDIEGLKENLVGLGEFEEIDLGDD